MAQKIGYSYQHWIIEFDIYITARVCVAIIGTDTLRASFKQRFKPASHSSYKKGACGGNLYDDCTLFTTADICYA